MVSLGGIRGARAKKSGALGRRSKSQPIGWSVSEVELVAQSEGTTPTLEVQIVFKRGRLRERLRVVGEVVLVGEVLDTQAGPAHWQAIGQGGIEQAIAVELDLRVIEAAVEVMAVLQVSGQLVVPGRAPGQLEGVRCQVATRQLGIDAAIAVGVGFALGVGIGEPQLVGVIQARLAGDLDAWISVFSRWTR